MKVFDLTVKFMSEDPKAKCLVHDSEKGDIYHGRVEFLVNCDNPIEELTINSLAIGCIIDATGKFESNTLLINV